MASAQEPRPIRYARSDAVTVLEYLKEERFLSRHIAVRMFGGGQLECHADLLFLRRNAVRPLRDIEEIGRHVQKMGFSELLQKPYEEFQVLPGRHALVEKPCFDEMRPGREDLVADVIIFENVGHGDGASLARHYGLGAVVEPDILGVKTCR